MAEVSLSDRKSKDLYAFILFVDSNKYSRLYTELKTASYVWDIEPVIGTTHTVPVSSAITSISPNPTSGLTVVSYRLGENYRSGASLAVVTAMGNRVMTVPITAGDSEGSANLNLQSVPGGQYIIQLIAGSDVLDVKPLVVE